MALGRVAGAGRCTEGADLFHRFAHVSRRFPHPDVAHRASAGRLRALFLPARIFDSTSLGRRHRRLNALYLGGERTTPDTFPCLDVAGAVAKTEFRLRQGASPRPGEREKNRSGCHLGGGWLTKTRIMHNQRAAGEKNRSGCHFGDGWLTTRASCAHRVISPWLSPLGGGGGANFRCGPGRISRRYTPRRYTRRYRSTLSHSPTRRFLAASLAHAHAHARTHTHARVSG